MSVKTDVSFHLFPSEKGYTLTMDFPMFGTKKEIPFAKSQVPEKGATVDLYSQNGKVGVDHPLSFFSQHDVKAIKGAVKLSLPKHEGKAQTLFVLDLKDPSGNYGDAESIRQS
jgi:hypothetical protein